VNTAIAHQIEIQESSAARLRLVEPPPTEPGDATQGRLVGSRPYDDASQGRTLGSDWQDDATRARPGRL
jgi:hypothetical protein